MACMSWPEQIPWPGPERCVADLPATSEYPAEEFGDDKDLALRLIAEVRGDPRLLVDAFVLLAVRNAEAGRQRHALRCRLFALAVAVTNGDDRAVRIRGFVASAHRAMASMFAAQAHNLAIIREPAAARLDRARAWAELAACQVHASPFVAERSARRAVALCDQSPDPELTRVAAIAHLELSAALRLTGRFAQASIEANAAIDLAGDDPMIAGVAAMRAGAAHMAAGDPEHAVTAFAKAIASFEGRSERNGAMARMRQAVCLGRLGRMDDALAALDEAERVVGTSRDPLTLRQIRLERATLLAEPDPEAALAELREVRRGGLPDSWETGRSWLEEARIRRHLGHEPLSAAACLGRALRLAATRRDPAAVASCLVEAFRLHDHLALAEARWLTAARWIAVALEGLTGDFGLVNERGTLRREREAGYVAAILAETAEGDPARAAALMDLGLAEAIEHRIAALPASGFFEVPRRPLGQNAARDLFAFASRLAADLTSDRTASGPLAEPPDLARRPGDGDAAELIVRIFSTPSGWITVTAWRSSAGDGWHAEYLDTPHEVARIFDALDAGRVLGGRGTRRSVWEKLGSVLIPGKLLEDMDECGRLYCAIDQRLWGLPFPALPAGGGRIADRIELVLVPSLAARPLLEARARPPRQNGPILTAVDPGFPEHAALAAWPGGQIPAAEATDDDFASAMMLYIAGHGNTPGITGELAVGGTPVTMEWLSGRRLPPVVVLAGCWSATPAGRAGEDPYALAIGALLGGADLVFAGTGRIGMAATTLIVEQILDRLGDGESPVPALRRAQLAVRDEYPGLGPYDWGALLTIGTAAR
jgi:tetratricopeptide (TPR) repeat protein